MKKGFLNFSILVISLFLLGLTSVEAKDYALTSEYATGSIEVIPDYAYVFGSYLFTEPSSRSDMNLVLASRSAYADDMYMAFFGNYYPTYGFRNTDDIFERGNVICIDHLNGSRIDDDCPGSGGGGGEQPPSGETVRVNFQKTINGNVTTVATIMITKGSQLSTLDSVVTAFEQDGYVLDYWTLNGVQFNFNTPINENIFLLAHYVPINFTINYDTNGGLFNDGTNSKERICNMSSMVANCTVLSEEPQREGYTFSGWSINKDDSDSSLISGGDQLSSLLIPSLENTNSVKLYAQWKPIEYSIKYILNGGQMYSGELQAKYTILDTINVSNYRPQREGYEFQGWSTVQNDVDLEHEITSIDRTFGTKELYAQWKPVVVTATFKKGSTPIRTNNNCAYDTCTVDVTESQVAKDGYNFLYFVDGSNYIYRLGEPIRALNNITLNAVYDDGNFYNISYALNGGSVDHTLATMYKTQSSGLSFDLPIPTKVGHSFNTWRVTNGQASIANNTNNRLVLNGSGDVSVEADFTKDEYTITYKYYNANGEMVTEPSNTKCKYGEECYIYKEIPSYDGVGIKYWLGNDSKQYGQGISVYDLTHNLVLTAFYGNEAGFHNIKYYDTDLEHEMNGSYFDGSYINKFSNDYAFNLPIPKKSGYRFNGWKNGDSNLGNYIPINYTNSDLDLVADWIPLSLSVQYDLNGASGSVQTKTCQYADSSCIIGNTPTRPGYSFLGWSLTAENNANSNKLLDANTDLFSILNGASTVKLHAIWKALDYPVIYNLNGGYFRSEDLENITYYTNLENPTINFAVPKKEGYTLGSWSVSYANYSSGNTATATAEDTVTNEKVYIEANWIPDSLNLSFKVDGSTYSNVTITSPCNYDSCAFTTVEPTKAGTSFKYWLDSEHGIVYNASGDAKGHTGILTLNAVFDDTVVSNISYQYDGGGMENSSYVPVTEYVEGKSTNLPIPVKTGYTFAGWKDSATNDVIWTIPATYTGNRSLTAQWQIKQYRVNFITLDSQDSVLMNFGEVVVLTEPDDLPYHSFTNWLVANSSGISLPAGQSITVNGDMTFIAQWDITTQYSIGYDLVGGEFNGSHPYSYTLGSSIPISVIDPQKEGYDFLGWNVTPSTASVTDEVLTVPTTGGDVELEATWKKVRFNINYDYAGGELAGNLVNPSYYQIGNNRIMPTIIKPQRAGYEFAGWQSNVSGITVGNSNKLSVSSSAEGDVTLTARWTKTRYNITYNLDGGVLGENVTNPSYYDLDLNNSTIYPTTILEPSSPIGEFAGWSVSSDHFMVKTNGNFVIDDIENAQDVTLTAQWEPKEFVISFKTSEDLNYSQSKTCVYGEPCDISNIQLPIVAGKTFKYWTNDSLGVVRSDQKLYVVSDIELTASFDDVSYAVNYDLDGGMFVSGQTIPTSINYGGNLVLPNNSTVETIVKDGYEFVGWYDSRDLSQSIITSIDSVTDDVYVTALWRKVRFNITYDYAGGELANGIVNPTYYETTNSNAVIINRPIRDGYTFSSWTSDVSDISVRLSNDNLLVVAGSEADVTLTAVWTPKTINISYYEDEDANNLITGNDYNLAITYGSNYQVEDYPASLLGMDEIFVCWLYDGHAYLPGDYLTLDSYTNNVQFIPVIISAISNDQIYHITYDTNDGGATSTTGLIDRFIVGDTFALSSLSRNGFTFLGWSTVQNDASGNNIVSTVANLEYHADSNNNVTLYAQWASNPYTVSFYDDTTQIGQSITCQYGISCDLSGVTEPTKAGFRFNGWTSNVPGVVLDANNHLTFNDYSYSSIIFNANWALGTFNLRFHSTDPNEDPIVKQINDNVDHYYAWSGSGVPDIDLISGWSTVANDTDVMYDNLYDFKDFVAQTNNVDLYPVLNSNDEFVIFNTTVRGYTHLGRALEVGFTNPITLIKGTTPDKAILDYTFNNLLALGADYDHIDYYLDQNNTELDFDLPINTPQISLEVDQNDYGISNNVYSSNLYVNVYKELYVVEFNDGQGNTVANGVCFYGENCDLSGPLYGVNPTKPGYNFVGWQSSVSGVSLNSNNQITYSDTDNDIITFTAQYEEIEPLENFVINFYDEDETLITSQSIEYGTLNTGSFLSDDEGYPVVRYENGDPVFYQVSGWSTEADGSNVICDYKCDFSQIVTDVTPISLYAVVDEDAELVQTTRRRIVFNQHGDIIMAGGTTNGGPNFFYGDTLGTLKSSANPSAVGRWYLDRAGEDEVDFSLPVNTTNWGSYLSACTDPMLPQVAWCADIYVREDIVMYDTYTVNFYYGDINNATLIESAQINYGDTYYFLDDQYGVDSWETADGVPVAADTDFGKLVIETKDSNVVNYYAVVNNDSEFVKVNYQVYYDDGTGVWVPVTNNQSGDIILGYGSTLNKTVLDNYFGATADYYQTYGTTNPVDFTQPLDTGSWVFSTFTPDSAYPNVTRETTVFVLVPQPPTNVSFYNFDGSLINTYSITEGEDFYLPLSNVSRWEVMEDNPSGASGVANKETNNKVRASFLANDLTKNEVTLLNDRSVTEYDYITNFGDVDFDSDSVKLQAVSDPRDTFVDIRISILLYDEEGKYEGYYEVPSFTFRYGDTITEKVFTDYFEANVDLPLNEYQYKIWVDTFSYTDSIDFPFTANDNTRYIRGGTNCDDNGHNCERYQAGFNAIYSKKTVSSENSYKLTLHDLNGNVMKYFIVNEFNKDIVPQYVGYMNTAIEYTNPSTNEIEYYKIAGWATQPTIDVNDIVYSYRVNLLDLENVSGDLDLYAVIDKTKREVYSCDNGIGKNVDGTDSGWTCGTTLLNEGVYYYGEAPVIYDRAENYEVFRDSSLTTPLDLTTPINDVDYNIEEHEDPRYPNLHGLTQPWIYMDYGNYINIRFNLLELNSSGDLVGASMDTYTIEYGKNFFNNFGIFGFKGFNFDNTKKYRDVVWYTDKALTQRADLTKDLNDTNFTFVPDDEYEQYGYVLNLYGVMENSLSNGYNPWYTDWRE